MTDSALVRLQKQDRVLVVHVDNPPVNALSPGVREGLLAALDQAEADSDVAAVVILGAGRTFIAGADIAELERLAWGELQQAPDLRPLLRRVEESRKPVVMAIHGTALGGGLELAMAGHFRVATPDARLGLPEVSLGIIPGAEGTQRLPRLAGVEQALTIIVSARPISAADAKAHGIVDAVVDDLLPGALALAADVIKRGLAPSRTSQLGERLGTPEANAPLFAAARSLAKKTRPHQVAPLKAIEAVEAATLLPFDEGSDRETALFRECVQSEPAKALIHVFFAERAVNKIPGTKARGREDDLPTGRVAIVGAGTMGGGIAMACANAGLEVRLRDNSHARLHQGLAAIRHNYAVSVTRGRFTEDAVTERLGRIHPQLDSAGFDQVDLVIEAVFEDLALKQQVFRELDAVARPGCILATNTSTIDIDAIASATSRPSDVVGLHFFSPANVMRLLEIVRGTATSPAIIAAAMALAKRLGKVGVLVGNCPGFVGNRMLFPYMYEAQYLVEEGATPQQVDEALTGFGMAMGPFAVDDMAGIDVAILAQRALGHFADGAGRRPLVQASLVEMGRLGQKTGKGWHTYAGDRKAVADPQVVDLIRARARESGIAQRDIGSQEIVERTIYALVNEGARALDEGFALRASDIDVIYVNGYGFPAWRGGPLFHADRVGLATVLDRIRALHDEHGSRWAPAPLLERLAATGGTFRKLDADRLVV